MPTKKIYVFCFVTEHRKMVTLKNYVHNKARPEGCITERYIDKECLTFYSMYLDNVNTIFNRPESNNEIVDKLGHLSIFSGHSHPFGGPKWSYLSDSELAKVHTFLLNNCNELEDYIK